MPSRPRTHPKLLDPSDIVGAPEIAARAAEYGVTTTRKGVGQWNFRREEWEKAGRPSRRPREEAMPAPLTGSDDQPVTMNGAPVWYWPDVLAWLQRTKAPSAEE